jgi:hypothetical protein
VDSVNRSDIASVEVRPSRNLKVFCLNVISRKFKMNKLLAALVAGLFAAGAFAAASAPVAAAAPVAKAEVKAEAKTEDKAAAKPAKKAKKAKKAASAA